MIMSQVSTSTDPTDPGPVASRHTSAGNPAAGIPSWIIAMLDSGVMLLGFSTTPLPAISAGITSPKPRTSG
jgi:hypothetical protein